MLSIKRPTRSLLALFALSCSLYGQGGLRSPHVTGSLTTGVLTAAYTSGITATGTGTCILVFTGGGGGNATASIAVTSNTPGVITILAAGGNYSTGPTGAVVSNGSLTCTGPAVLTGTVGTVPLIPVPTTFYETWNPGGQSCTAFTGTCIWPWQNTLSSTNSIVTAASASMSGLPWSMVAGTNVLQVTTVASAVSYISAQIPAYIPNPSQGGSITLAFPWQWSTCGLASSAALQMVTLGESPTQKLANVNFHSTGASCATSAQLAAVGTTASSNITVAKNTPLIVVVNLSNGTNGSSLAIYSKAGVPISGSPVVFTVETHYGNQVFLGNLNAIAGVNVFDFGNIIVASSLAPTQINPPNVVITGNGTTNGNVLALADFQNGNAAQGYCNGAGGSGFGTYGWVNQLGATPVAPIWSYTQVIAPYSPLTAGGTQYRGASPLMSIGLTYDLANGYMACQFTTQSLNIVDGFDFTVVKGGSSGQQDYTGWTAVGGASDYVGLKDCQVATNGCVTYESPTTQHLACLEVENWGATGFSNCTTLVFNHWYHIDKAMQLGQPATGVIYDKGVAPWIASTAYSAGAIVSDLASPYHCQTTVAGGTSGSSAAGPSQPSAGWNDSGGSTSDGTITWADSGVCPAPTLIQVMVGSSTPYNGTLPNKYEAGLTGEPNGTAIMYIANFHLDYTQGRLTTLQNISTGLCPSTTPNSAQLGKPGCPAASDLTLISGTTGTSATWPFYAQGLRAGTLGAMSDVNRLINITGTISGSCNVAGGSHAGGAYQISSVHNVPITFTGTNPVIATGAQSFIAGQIVQVGFQGTGGVLPVAFNNATNYFVLATSLTSTTMELSLTMGGSAITPATAGTGTFFAADGIAAFDGTIGTGGSVCSYAENTLSIPAVQP